MYAEDVTDLIQRAAKGRWTTLNLNNHSITTLPQEIGKLNKLRQLSVSGNSLNQISPEIGRLTNLKELNLSNNQISSLPIEIGQLSKLRHLNVSSNSLVTLPSTIGQLRKLEEFNLRHNLITLIPSEIGYLSSLKELDLGNNKLNSLPLEIKHLINLINLNLRFNPLSSIPSEVCNLIHLRILDFSNTQVAELPSAINNLNKLIRVSARSSKLTIIPPSVSALSKLKFLELEGSPVISPPIEVRAQGTEAILAFLRNLSVARSERFEAKVLLLGQGGVGKTSVLRSLLMLRFQSDEDTTKGVDIASLELPHPSRQDVNLKLNVWDFAGQEIEHATHQFFMSSKSIYLLVWNARHGYVQGRLDYWLEMIKSRAPGSPVLLVATHIDQRMPDINFGALQQAFPQLVAQCSVDNQSGTGIAELKHLIARYTSELPHMGQTWPSNWQDVENDLRELNEHHISYERFEEICLDNQLTNSQDISTLSETLHSLGIILHFGDDVSLRNLVILKPNWITKAISYALTDRATAMAFGLLDHRALPRIWENYHPTLYSPFFSLMNKFELCYQVDDTDNLSLIPALLSYAPPPIPEISRKLKMVYRLSSVPPGLMSRFIVRTHRFTMNLHWREGVFLSYDGQTARAELLEHPREFHLTVDGSSPTNFFAVLTDTLNQIFKSFPGLGVERKIPCICQGDGIQDRECKYMFSYEDCVRRKDKGKEAIECNISLEEVSLNKLLYGIHELSRYQVREQVDKVSVEPVENYRQVILLGQRGVIHNYNRLESIDSRCPNVFVLSQASSRTLALQLICQSSDGWHFASPTAMYEVPDEQQYRSTLAPILFETLPLLPHVVPLSGLNVSLQTNIPKKQKKSLQSSIDFIRELVTTVSVEQGGVEAIRDSLRELKSLLRIFDREETYGGLRLTATPDGLRRWLCPYHYAQYQQTPLNIGEIKFDTFLCHNSEEKVTVRRIARRLKDAGISYWLDEEQMLGGDRWQDAMTRGLREAATTVVIIGEHGWGDWQLEELQVALNQAAGKRGHRIIPLLLYPLAEVPADFPAFLKTRHALIFSSFMAQDEIEMLIHSIRGE